MHSAAVTDTQHNRLQGNEQGVKRQAAGHDIFQYEIYSFNSGKHSMVMFPGIVEVPAMIIASVVSGFALYA